MIEANKAVVKAYLKALGGGDVEALKQVLTADVAAICTGTSLLSGTRNHADICAAAGFLGAVTKAGIDFRILAMTAEEDRVSCEVEGYSTLVSGQDYNNQYNFLFFIRDGRIWQIKEYIDTKLTDAVLAPLMQGASQQ